MRRFLPLTLFFLLFAANQAWSFGSIACGRDRNGYVMCEVTSAARTPQEAIENALASCRHSLQQCYTAGTEGAFTDACQSVAADANRQKWYSAIAPAPDTARLNALSDCLKSLNQSCLTIASVCDASEQAPDQGSSGSPYEFLSHTDYWVAVYLEELYEAVFNRYAIGIGLAFAVLLFLNLIMNRGLPRALPVYGEDVQCLFKRVQRINWRGRVVFGIIANLAMTQQQLIDTRKYRLGRVVAFDSLRRQRQNELARMHLQLAASTTSDPHDKKNFWSRRWATIRTFIRRLFWIFTALFSFLLGFLFIRITIAKLVRGTIVESKDLVLILQAKDAIEDSTKYLKEYLTTANTFDGRDEVYEPQ